MHIFPPLYSWKMNRLSDPPIAHVNSTGFRPTGAHCQSELIISKPRWRLTQSLGSLWWSVYSPTNRMPSWRLSQHAQLLFFSLRPSNSSATAILERCTLRLPQFITCALDFTTFLILAVNHFIQCGSRSFCVEPGGVRDCARCRQVAWSSV